MRKASLVMVLAVVGGVVACGDEGGTADAVASDASDASDTGTAPDVGDAAGDVVAPGPALRVVGARLASGGAWQDGARVTATWTGDRLAVGVAAGPAVGVDAVEVELALALPGATAWLSNGFQSWSQSGALALPTARPAEGDVLAALSQQGDIEVLRDGTALSWWLSWVATPPDAATPAAVVAGALSAARLAATVTAWRDGDEVHLVLRSGGNGDRLEVAADAPAPIETWLVVSGAGPDALQALLAAFGDALPSRRAAHRVTPEAGWNSWYELFTGVDEAAVRANAAALAEGLTPHLPIDAPPLRVVVDDGWERGWGDWYPNDKFPSGLDGLAADLKSDGFTMGVWLAPLLVAADSQLAKDHPDWLVGGVTWNHVVEGPMRVLDPFQPGAADHLRATAARIVGWGYDLLKIDFLFAGTFPGARAAPRTGMEAYVRALELLREGAGESATLVAVGNPATPALPFVDVWRVGGDIAVLGIGPSFPFVVNELRSVAARYPFCRATLCDADPPIFRALSPAEVEVGAWVAAATGGAFFLSDDLRALPTERLALGPALVGVGLSGRAAVPLDLVPPAPPETLASAIADQLGDTRTQVAPARWRLPNGRVLALDLAAGAATRERWAARAGVSWQIQLEGALERTADVAAYDVDLFDVTPRERAALQRDGRAVICYFSAGSWEDWRPDKDAFPEAARGKPLDGFPDERWLDVRREDVRAALAARMDRAVAEGCDAIDPDNVQAFQEDTGFPLTADDQLAFNRWLAAEGHARGLAVGLKNDLGQAAALAADFDFAVNESCLVYDECDPLRAFIDLDKAVLHIEYADEGATLASVCADPARAGFSTVLKTSTADVDAAREACP